MLYLNDCQLGRYWSLTAYPTGCVCSALKWPGSFPPMPHYSLKVEHSLSRALSRWNSPPPQSPACALLSPDLIPDSPILPVLAISAWLCHHSHNSILSLLSTSPVPNTEHRGSLHPSDGLDCQTLGQLGYALPLASQPRICVFITRHPHPSIRSTNH
jgi:hypothetical protein